MRELPIIDLTADNLEEGLNEIALVENPAIQKSFFAFKEDEEPQEYKFQTIDEEKRILAGALLVADFPIYRNQNGKEFYARFTKANIEKIVDKAVKNKLIDKFNFEHQTGDLINDIYIQQHFIVDSVNGVNAPNYYPTLSDGSWFGFIKVNNDEVWNDYVKTGKVKGFSIEGLFGAEKIENNTNKMKQENQSKFNSIVEGLKKLMFGEEPTMTEKTLTNGSIVVITGELMAGSDIVNKDGSAIEDGQLTAEDGTIIVVEGGKVKEVVAPEPPAPKPAPEPKTFTATDFDSANQLFEKFQEGDQMAKLVAIVKFMFEDMYGWRIKEEQNKQEIATHIQSIQTMSSQIETITETQKQFLEALQLSVKQDDPIKQQFSENKRDSHINYLMERFNNIN